MRSPMELLNRSLLWAIRPEAVWPATFGLLSEAVVSPEQWRGLMNGQAPLAGTQWEAAKKVDRSRARKY